MHTAESIFSNFLIEYLGKIETEFKNTLACLSEAQMGLNHEKNRGRKSCDTLPFRELVIPIWFSRRKNHSTKKCTLLEKQSKFPL